MRLRKILFKNLLPCFVICMIQSSAGILSAQVFTLDYLTYSDFEHGTFRLNYKGKLTSFMFFATNEFDANGKTSAQNISYRELFLYPAISVYFSKEMPGISNLQQHEMYSAYQTSEITNLGIALLNKIRIQHQRKSLLRLPTRYSHSFESKNDSSLSQKPIKYLMHGLIGAAGFSIVGSLIASGKDRKCTSNAVFRVCSTSERNDRIGFTIGATTGSIFGYMIQTRKFKKKKGVLLPIVLGSIAGGVGSYLLDDVIDIGPLSLIFPPVTAFLSLIIFSPEF